MGGEIVPGSVPAVAHVIRAEQPVVSRAQVASTMRAFQDVDAHISNSRAVLADKMTNAASMGQQDFQEAWEARKNLNQLHDQLNDLRVGLEKHMPAPSDFQAPLTPEEKTQIVGLYASGLYTQRQLAEQYGVSQPTVGRAVSGAEKA